MTPEQLKASILQYAIQGKLVEQRAEEGTAEELYQQIQAEAKERSIWWCAVVYLLVQIQRIFGSIAPIRRTNQNR